MPFNSQKAIYNKRTNPVYHQLYNRLFQNMLSRTDVKPKHFKLYNLKMDTNLQSVQDIPKQYYSYLPIFFFTKGIDIWMHSILISSFVIKK